MYILDEFTFRERPDLAINHEGEFESIIAEIEPKQGGKKLMLAEIYRIPNTSQGGGGGKGGCENARPENNFSKNREREITLTEIREREIRR